MSDVRREDTRDDKREDMSDYTREDRRENRREDWSENMSDDRREDRSEDKREKKSDNRDDKRDPVILGLTLSSRLCGRFLYLPATSSGRFSLSCRQHPP